MARGRRWLVGRSRGAGRRGARLRGGGQLSAKLSHRESALLALLARHQLLERKATLLQLWDDDSFFHARSMDVFISRLRKHLRHDVSVAILSVRGVGHRLIS